MFIIKGTRTARIKTYKDHEHSCGDCKDFDLTVKVYREYFHFFFIPIAATGLKTVKIRCNRCGEPYRSDTLNKIYEKETHTPFYLYMGTILVSLLVVAGISLSVFSEHQRSNLVLNPRVGDVYLIKREIPLAKSYYFIRIMRIIGDTVVTYTNKLEYNNIVSEFNTVDHFVSGTEVVFTKQLLKEMQKNYIVVDVDRDYDDSKGFNRVEKE